MEQTTDKTQISNTAKSIIQTLSNQLDLSEQFASDAAVNEGYTIKQHTLFVVSLFDHYFAHTSLPLDLTIKDWRIFLSLHDVLGKPEAIIEGNKSLQHEYLFKNLPKSLGRLGYNSRQVKIAQSLLANDSIGEYVQRKSDLLTTIDYVNQLAAAADAGHVEALTAQVIYWICDAGSYTSQIGPQGSLDYLFDFDNQAQTVQVLPPASQMISTLWKAVSEQ